MGISSEYCARMFCSPAQVVPDKLPDMDNEGRPFNVKLVVINFANAAFLRWRQNEFILRHGIPQESVRGRMLQLLNQQ